MSDIRQVHDELMKIHEEIRQEYAQLDESTLGEYLGDFYCELHSQVREHGDGYTLRSVPADIKDMLCADDIVLFVMKYPQLAHNSVFNPHTDLATIPYWQDGKVLRQDACLYDGSTHMFHFLVWEHDYPTHGNIKCGPRAGANKRLISKRRRKLSSLMRNQERVSECFIMALKDWLRGEDRKLVVWTNAQKNNFNPPVERIIQDDAAVCHMKTNLYTEYPNTQIMKRLIARAWRNSPR